MARILFPGPSNFPQSPEPQVSIQAHINYQNSCLVLKAQQPIKDMLCNMYTQV
jgi:hypothetical protein